jgi:hypothetical protein
MPSKYQVDVGDFLKDWNFLRREALPKAVVKGFAHVAERARDAVRSETRAVFELHTEYIPNAIKSLPGRKNTAQINAATRGLTSRHKDFSAYVLIRGARSPQKSLEFMVLHETGGQKTPVDGQLALPRLGLREYDFRTGKGRTRKHWKPARLLEYYNMVGASKAGSKRHGRTRGKPKAFILNSRKGRDVLIARRKNRRTRELEILYRLTNSARIDKRWNFEGTVHSTAPRYIHADVNREINKIRL